MYEPNPEDPEFGSELRRRQTPGFRRLQRRKGITAALVGIVMGVVMLIIGINAMRTGEMVRSGHFSSLPPLPGEIFVLMGLFLLALCVWLIWRLAADKG
jgi:hypothetical protein